MSKKYEFPKSMHNVSSHYCGGCGHGIVHKLICQIIDEMKIQQDVLLVAPVGCAVYAYNYKHYRRVYLRATNCKRN